MQAPQTPQTLLARLRAGVAGRGGGVTVGILVFALILIGGLWAMILTEEQEERDEIIATAVK